MARKKASITKKQIRTIQETLHIKLGELLLLREEVEYRENLSDDLGERKELVQQLIDLNHQIQAVRSVIELFTEKK
jgi:hypothetical protein